MARDAGSKGRGGTMHGSLAPKGVSELSNNPSKGNTPGKPMSVREQNQMAMKAQGMGKDKRMS